jgi:lipopolysaccharide transport system ATP-binding protein
MQTVAGLTERAILLHAGHVLAIGRSTEIIEHYLASQIRDDAMYRKAASGTQPEITRVELHTSDPGQLQQFGKPMRIDIEISAPEQIPNSAISFQIMTNSHQPVLHVLNLDAEVPMLRSAGTHRLTCLFPRLRLYPGNYYLNLYFGATEPRRVFEAPQQICPFEVAVLDEVREFYWYPKNALYVEDVEWISQVVPADETSTPDLQSQVRPHN